LHTEKKWGRDLLVSADPNLTPRADPILTPLDDYRSHRV
jgi:hypothetical protein